MGRRRVERAIVTRVTNAGVRRRVPDRLIVEEPLTIQLDGATAATTMRTPGHDFELAAGFCFTEGLLGSTSIHGIRYCADGSAVDSYFNVVTVDTGGNAAPPTARLGPVGSSCGWCGSQQLDRLADRLTPLDPIDVTDALLDLARTVPHAVRERQGLFASTGAVHAAAAFDMTGDVVVAREDVGRHNAVDKVVGALLLDPDRDARDRPGAGRGLFVSGRASIEMVQKAWAAGFVMLVAVSAPTALAVDAARRANLVLVGFVRDDEFNLYSPARGVDPVDVA
jgi:FdhD protein